jgi:gluconokinase
MIYLVMGVTGSGKSTVGKMLADRLGWVYLEADDFHSAANKEKMHRGEPLTEADRLPWLAAMHRALKEQNTKGKNAVLACSALTEEYRQILMKGLTVKLIYLRGSRDLIASRLSRRKHHFAGVSILDDQFAVLEEPQNALVVGINGTPQQIFDEILQKLQQP